MVGPGSSHRLDLALRKMGIELIIVHSLQFWFVASTILATALFVRMRFWKNSPKPTKVDWTLFLTWWLLVAIVCSFAFMIGLGG